jgi:hypothetical protein
MGDLALSILAYQKAIKSPRNFSAEHYWQKGLNSKNRRGTTKKKCHQYKQIFGH